MLAQEGEMDRQVIIQKKRGRWGSKNLGNEQDNFPLPDSFIPRNESIDLLIDEFKLVQHHLRKVKMSQRNIY